MNEADDPIDDLLRPLPPDLERVVDGLEPAPPASMDDMPDWARTLIHHHSHGSIDAADLPGLKRSTDPRSFVIGTLEFEGVFIEFQHGGTARALAGAPQRRPDDDWMHECLTDYWDTRVDAVDAACHRLATLDPPARAGALVEIERAVSEHVRALGDEHLIKACVPIADDLYRAAKGWTESWGRDPFDFLTASAGTLGRLLVDRGIQIQYLVDDRWDDPTGAIDLLRVWFAATGFNLISPHELAREIAMSKGARGDDEVSRQALGCIAEARREANELTRECQELGGHLVVFDDDGEEEAWSQALKRRGEAGVVTILRSAAHGSGSAWIPEPA